MDIPKLENMNFKLQGIESIHIQLFYFGSMLNFQWIFNEFSSTLLIHQSEP